jgi:hypothetical protein
LSKTNRIGDTKYNEACGCYSVHFSCSPTSTD